MKRLSMLLLVFAAMSVSIVWADDNSVLQEARRRSSGSEKDQDSSDSYSYTPLVLAFTPGLSSPLGIYDTSAAFGVIGSLVGSVSGVQLSSVFSLSQGNVYGVQGSGVFNIADGDLYGAQLAGVFNISDGAVSFVQAAGVFNISKDASGVQSAGLFNIADNVSGVQSAGLFNVVDSISGVQAAGLFNIADSAHGVMAAGLFNVAGSVDGVMFGMVNVVDELHGAAFGLVNVIGNGVRDLSFDRQSATKTAYIGYRTGTTTLYASFFGGLPTRDIFETTENMTAGFGIGHREIWGPFAWDFEAGAESAVSEETLDRFGDLFTDHGEGCRDAFDSLPVFATFRTTFGFGGRGGFGVYIGMKADFQAVSIDRIPEHLRSGASDEGELFGLRFEYWPKFFIGMRF